MIGRKYRKFPTRLLFPHWVDQVITVAQANRCYFIQRHGTPTAWDAAAASLDASPRAGTPHAA
jgi:hypothetical protein